LSRPGEPKFSNIPLSMQVFGLKPGIGLPSESPR
jgi:hypothetical protein